MDILGPVQASPVIGDNAVFIGTAQFEFFALSILNGSILQQFKSEGNIFETAGFAEQR